ERILGDARFALAAMGSDREPVGLVAQALQVVEDRAFLVEPERWAAGNEETLPARIAIDALGDAGEDNAGFQPQFHERFEARIQLAFAAVDQHQIGPSGEFRLAELRLAELRLNGFAVAFLGKVDAAVFHLSPGLVGRLESLSRIGAGSSIAD